MEFCWFLRSVTFVVRKISRSTPLSTRLISKTKFSCFNYLSWVDSNIKLEKKLYKNELVDWL